MSTDDEEFDKKCQQIYEDNEIKLQSIGRKRGINTESYHGQIKLGGDWAHDHFASGTSDEDLGQSALEKANIEETEDHLKKTFRHGKLNSDNIQEYAGMTKLDDLNLRKVAGSRIFGKLESE